MLCLNRVTLLGHAGRDPESRELQDGEKKVWFSLATTRRWKGRDGEAVEKTEWHRIVVFGGAAGPAGDMVRKGVPVLVEGRLATREFEDREGNTRTVTEVVVAGPQGLVNVLSRKPAVEDAAVAREPEAGGGDDAAAAQEDGATGGGDEAD